MYESQHSDDIDFGWLTVRGATLDELLSEDFEALPGNKSDADLAARRLAAWCRSCASGDWLLFSRRLERDRLSFSQVLSKLASVRRRASAPVPQWLTDARWIIAALNSPINGGSARNEPDGVPQIPFEPAFAGLVDEAVRRLWSGLSPHIATNLTSVARASLQRTLLEQLGALCAPVLFERFDLMRKTERAQAELPRTRESERVSCYERFITSLRGAELSKLFEEKPVLLRLIAALTRQWINTTGELLSRLDADLLIIRRELLPDSAELSVANIQGGFSDQHNNGRTVQIVTFENGSRIVYKPKDIRLDAKLNSLIGDLNRTQPPIDLRTVHALPRDGYGWTEFIDHHECADRMEFDYFFRRAGAWLALFHVFVGADMHEENVIAAGDHPVPIDLEMILQASTLEHKSDDPDLGAFNKAAQKIADSVTMVGLLPTYARSPENIVHELGGMNNQRGPKRALHWSHVNSDEMCWSWSNTIAEEMPNMARVGDEYARLGDYIDSFIHGFESYAAFLMRQSGINESLDGFAGVATRKVLRSTHFYGMLLERLRDHRSMDDGAIWSAQADFIARLSDWDTDADPMWPLQRAERAALLELNVPHFVSPSDADLITDGSSISVNSHAVPGIERARARIQALNRQEIAWQSEVIRQSTSTISATNREQPTSIDIKGLHSNLPEAPPRQAFLAEADQIVELLRDRAIRSGAGAAWLGLDWMGDTEVCQLVPLGQDLYNGASGIAVFLAAHMHVTGQTTSGELALAAVAGLRKSLRSANAAHMSRLLGIGGVVGLGSIVYALSLLGKYLGSEALINDAAVAARLISDDLIAADKLLDVTAGSAGAILALLSLYRVTDAEDVLKRATACGEHLLRQHRVGPAGRRTWIRQEAKSRALNGMSHGAAGFAYALASLSIVTEREEFASAAVECMTFENDSYNPLFSNWPALCEASTVRWACQWCYGATGIGLARAATLNRGFPNAPNLKIDVDRALQGLDQNWRNTNDTLCCGSLGGIEFLCEAGKALGRADLRDLASRRLMALIEAAASRGDYRRLAGSKYFNLGLYRGVAGLGYTFLRMADPTLSNVIVWE